MLNTAHKTKTESTGGIMVLVSDGENNVLRRNQFGKLFGWPDEDVLNRISSQNVRLNTLGIG